MIPLELEQFLHRVGLWLAVDDLVTLVTHEYEIFVRIDVRRLPVTAAPGPCGTLGHDMRNLTKRHWRILVGGILQQVLPTARKGANPAGLHPENLLGPRINRH